MISKINYISISKITIPSKKTMAARVKAASGGQMSFFPVAMTHRGASTSSFSGLFKKTSHTARELHGVDAARFASRWRDRVAVAVLRAGAAAAMHRASLSGSGEAVAAGAGSVEGGGFGESGRGA